MPDRTYTISELAKEFGVTTRTIRFYEEKGLISPLREGQKRLYTPADRVRIKLILRGKRIGMTLNECVEVIDMYQPGHSNEEQLHSLLRTVGERRDRLLQQKKDIDDMLARLDEVRSLCEASLASNYPTAPKPDAAGRKALRDRRRQRRNPPDTDLPGTVQRHDRKRTAT